MRSSILCSFTLLLPLLSLLDLTSASPVVVRPPSQESLATRGFPHLFSRAVAGPTCKQTADCSNAVPVNANRYCSGGRCSFRCRSGFIQSGNSCLKPSSSSTSPASASKTTPPARTATPSTTCKVTSDCAQAVPANANRYCNKGVCSWRCKTGFTSTGSACLKPGTTSSSSSSRTTTTLSTSTRMSTSTRPASTTIITSPSSATSTCAETADCPRVGLPSNAHAYCGKGICSFRCNTGYSLSSDGKTCQRPAASSTSSSSSFSSTTFASTTTTSSASLTSSSSSSSAATITSSTSVSGSTTAASSTTTTTTTTTTTETTSKYTWNNTPTRTFSTSPTPPAATPRLVQSYTGDDFFNPDKWWTFNYTDPTEGTVNYLQLADLVARNLTSLPSPGVARLSVDSLSSLSLGENRDSVRISSVETVEVGSLVIADFGHIPAACGAWPAFWLYSDPWPENGEIDVLETVNLRTYNSMTLHTISGCERNPRAEMSGTWAYSASRVSCDAEIGSSCTAQDPGPDAVGAGFNDKGGGVFAVQIAETGISIWRWNRANIPADVLAGDPRPQSWGLPVAVRDGSTCDTRTYFSKLWITPNITICGRMAGKTSTWRSASGSGSCYPRYATCAEAAMDPAAFSEAYFDVNYIKVFSV